MKRVLVAAVGILLGAVCMFGQETVDRDAGIELYRTGEYLKAVVKLEPLVLGGQSDRIGAMYLAGSYVQLKRSKDAVALFKQIRKGKFGVWKDQSDSDQRIKFTVRGLPKFDPDDLASGRDIHVYLAVEFRADGKIGFIFPYDSSSPLTAQTGIDATKQIKFEPALHNGKPVTVLTLVDYDHTFH